MAPKKSAKKLSSSSSVEKELCHAVAGNDVAALTAVLDRPGVEAELRGKKEWIPKDGSFGSPLHLAVYSRNDEMVGLLVEAGVDVDSYSVDGGDRLTALHDAVLGDNPDAVKMLLRMGADRKLTGTCPHLDVSGTALNWAVKLGHDEIAQILRDYDPAPSKFVDDTILLKSAIKRVRSSKAALEKELGVGNMIAAKMIKLEDKERLIDVDIAQLEDKKKVIHAEFAKLEADKGHRSEAQLRSIKDQLDEIGKLSSAAVQENDKRPAASMSCPECILAPEKIFTCPGCHSWVCEACKDVLVACSPCGTDLKANPLTRSEAMEKAFLAK